MLTETPSSLATPRTLPILTAPAPSPTSHSFEIHIRDEDGRGLCPTTFFASRGAPTYSALTAQIARLRKVRGKSGFEIVSLEAKWLSGPHMGLEGEDGFAAAMAQMGRHCRLVVEVES